MKKSKLNEQLQRVKNEVITFNPLPNIIDKLEVLEKDVEELNKNKCSRHKCMPFNCCSFSLI